MLVRYALDGDADLSGGVNLADFNRLAANFGQTNKQWVDGDSTYDGLVNLADFNALAGNFGMFAAADNEIFKAAGPFGSSPIRGTRSGEELRKLLELS
jgi:hypothetical protein